MKVSENKEQLPEMLPLMEHSWPTKLLLSWGGLIVAVATLGQLQRFQLTSAVAFYLQDVLLAGWLGIWWWLKSRPWLTHSQWQKSLKSGWTVVAIWIGLGWFLAALATDWQQLLRPFLYLLRIVSVWMFARCLAEVWPKSHQWIPQLGLILAGGLVFVWGLIQFIWLPDTRFLKTFGWDDHYYRLIGTLFDPGFTGLLLTMTALSLVGWLAPKLWQERPRVSWWWLAVGSLVLTGGVLLTYSRASYISLAVSMAWLGWQAWRQRQLQMGLISLLTIVCLVGGIPFLPKAGGEGVQLERTSTITARIDTNWLVLSELQPIEWWLGRGLFVSKSTPTQNNLNLPNHAQLPDNLFILLFTGVGVGGLLVGLKVFARPVWHWWRVQPPWLQSIWLAVLVHSLFNNSLFQPQIWLFLQLWTAFGTVTVPSSKA